MTFKVCKFSFLVFFVFLLHCQLKTGEKAPSIPLYQPIFLSQLPSSDDCANLNSKEEFISYLFPQEQVESQQASANFTKWLRVLDCLHTTISETSDLIQNDFLDKSELSNLLNHELVKTTTMAPIIDNFLDPKNFDDYLFIKSTLIRLLEKDLEHLPNESICQKIESTFVISKHEINVFLEFLDGLYDFFVMLDKQSVEVFDQFFKERLSVRDSLFNFSSPALKKEFFLFLSEYLSESLPNYSLFLKSSSLQSEKAIKPFIEMAKISSNDSNRFTVQNIKYMLLNVYVMESIFSAYDINGNSTLESNELKSFSCMITTFISIVVSEDLKNQRFYNHTIVSNYIIKNQEIPTLTNWAFIWYRMWAHRNKIKNLSYTDVSRLTGLFLSKFLNKVYSDFQKK